MSDGNVGLRLAEPTSSSDEISFETAGVAPLGGPNEVENRILSGMANYARSGRSLPRTVALVKSHFSNSNPTLRVPLCAGR